MKRAIKVSATCFLFSLSPSLAIGQSALEHHVWQDQRSFEPMSRTAAAITGKIKLSRLSEFARPGTKMAMTFGNGKSVGLTSVGASWREWNDGTREKVTAEVFRFDHDPGKLEQGNTLCGGDARYVAFFEFEFLGRQLLGLDVFKSEQVPKDIYSPNLCGTFNFEIQ